MQIILGQSLSDQQTLPAAPVTSANQAMLTPSGLLRFLEGFYALGAPSVNREALRTEQYRQLISLHLGLSEDGTFEQGFYEASFRADQTATATELLSRRDELLDAGYQLHRQPTGETPTRLRVLHEIEGLLLDDTYELNLMAGPADRLNLLLSALPEDRHPRLTIYLNEPRHLQSPGTRRLLTQLEALGDTIQPLPDPEPLVNNTDLANWQSILRQNLQETPPTSEPSPLSQGPPLAAAQRKGPGERVIQADQSLIILKAQRETHIAAYLAKLLKDNPDWRPGALLTVRNQTLDNALLSEGLPSLGVPSTSLARPSLQVLKLITTFLWQPLDISRVMEFVSLVTKPLHWRLGQRIAVFLADTPGMFGPRWFSMIDSFFREMETERNWPAERSATVRKQYELWFRRKRYRQEESVPSYDLRLLFHNLREWALEEYTDLRKKDRDQPGLLVLAAQCLRATELLDARPEGALNYLEVERLVRTVYEPAPTRFQFPEHGALSTIFAPASALKMPDGECVKDLLWWDFIEHEPDYFFSRYYPEELSYLQEAGVHINGPDEQNELSAWKQLRPILHARRQVVLCLPERVDGAAVEPHALMGDLEAAFPDGALDAITVHIDAGGEAPAVLANRQTPAFAPVPVRPLARPVAHLQVDKKYPIAEREYETPTSLEDLLYYPHKWIFRHQLELRGTPILSIAAENRLRGNLSHLFIEKLLDQIKADERPYEKEEVHAWVNENANQLLSNQGAVLLEYGQEPERIQFIRTMHYAAWSLVHYIQENGWTIRNSEEKIEGRLLPDSPNPVQGRADLVLERHRHGKKELAIVDLKWRGKTTFKNLLRNAKDVQLCLYADFLRQQEGDPNATVHTTYYVLRDALMLGRNELAFANIETVSGADEANVVQQETLRKIRATHNWRWTQFNEGAVEVRCQYTLGDLQDLYLDLDHDGMLELGEEDARFDDYRSLIGLVR